METITDNQHIMFTPQVWSHCRFSSMVWSLRVRSASQRWSGFVSSSGRSFGGRGCHLSIPQIALVRRRGALRSDPASACPACSCLGPPLRCASQVEGGLPAPRLRGRGSPARGCRVEGVPAVIIRVSGASALSEERVMASPRGSGGCSVAIMVECVKRGKRG